MKFIALVAVLMISASAVDLEILRGNLISYHINFNCLASIAFFSTHYFKLYNDGLISSLYPEIKEWIFNFILNSVAHYWVDIYDDT